MRNPVLLVLLFALALTSCSTGHNDPLPPTSTVYADQRGNIDTSHSPTVALRYTKDTQKLSANLSARLEKAGFKMLKDSGTPDYYADIDYKTYWDVVHQTFVYFQIDLVDAKTGESRIRLRYIGGAFSSNGCNRALDMVFEDLSLRLKNGT